MKWPLAACLLAGIFLSACGKSEKPASGAEDAPAEKAGPQLVLAAKKSSPDVQIVVAEGSLATPKAAAAELQRLVQAATGRLWPIVSNASGEGIHIIVGPHPLAEEAGIRASDIPPEGFRLAVRGRNLFIVGHDTPGNPWDMHWMRACQTGTLYGVVEFARRFFHARWLLPGPDGEVLSRVDRLVIPQDLDVADRPWFRSRRSSGLDNSKPESARYSRFNRLGNSFVTCFWHNWYQTISPEVYSREHPGWFALVNGVRSTHLRGKSMDGQLCPSNPEVVKKMADIAVQYSRENPVGTMFSLSENDGGNHCQCPNCRALDQESWAPGLPSLSDRLATFANGVREAIGDRAPELPLGYYAYHQGELPPVKTKLLPGIVVSDVCNGYDAQYNVPELAARRRAMMKGWRESAQSVVMCSYFHGITWWSLPMFSPDALADLIKTAALYPSSSGFYLGLTYEAFGMEGNENFLANELLWNPAAETSKILEDYYATGFGPAAGAIRGYFDNIRLSFAAAAKQLPKAMDETRPDTWIPATYDPIRVKEDLLIKAALQAVAASPDAPLRNRVQLVADGWKWTKIQCDVLKRIKDYQGAPSQEKARELVTLITAREDFIKEHGKPGDYTFSAKDVEIADFEHSLPVKLDEYEMAAVGEVKKVRVPVLPGGANAPAVLSMVENRKGAAADPAPQVAVQASKDGLTFGFDLPYADPKGALATVTQSDGKVWEDDDVEIFLKPARRSKVCYQVAANLLGTICDVRHEGAKDDVSWDSGAQTSVRQTPQGWHVKVAIPFKALGVPSAPLPGDIWTMNVTYSRHGSDAKDMAWSPTFGLFLRPERFGEMIFTDK